MSKTSTLSIIVLLIVGYLGYNKFYAEPKEVVSSAKSMLFQMAVKEKWIDGFGIMVEIDSGDGTLLREIAVASNYDNVVYATGKIEYLSSTQAMCKEVDFTFKTGSLNTYEITSERNC